MIDRAFHVLILVAFLSAVGAAFLGMAAPLLFPDRREIRLPALRTSALLALGAALLLGVEAVAHRLF